MARWCHKVIFVVLAQLVAHIATEPCSGLLLDAPPARAPIGLLRVLAHLFKDKDVVDLRPTADADACYSHSARSVVAFGVVGNDSECSAYEAAVGRHNVIHAQLSVVCGKDFRRDLPPDGDIFTWWQRLPMWANGAVLNLLKGAVARGAIRPSAHALILYDLTSWRDAGDWQHAQSDATWWHQSSFDERRECLATMAERHRPLCMSTMTSKGLNPGRACGRWAAGLFPLNANATPHNASKACPWASATGGALSCVDGHADADLSCEPGLNGIGGNATTARN